MLAVMGKRQDAMVVARGEAPFIGISGRQVASLETGTIVLPIGQHGSYTIVHWQGRNGYVPSDCLLDLDEYEAEVARAGQAVVSSPSDEGRESPGWPKFLLPWRRRVA